jgi:hypothetical protein
MDQCGSGILLLDGNGSSSTARVLSEVLWSLLPIRTRLIYTTPNVKAAIKQAEQQIFMRDKNALTSACAVNRPAGWRKPRTGSGPDVGDTMFDPCCAERHS